MNFNPVYEMVHASANTTYNYPIFKVRINGIIAAYLYGCVASSVGLRILYGDPSQPNTVFKVKNSLMDGDGNVWLLVVGIPKHDTYLRSR